MRQEDFEEVARVLGDGLRLCAPNEYDGIMASLGALLAHLEHHYPDFNEEEVDRAFIETVHQDT